MATKKKGKKGMHKADLGGSGKTKDPRTVTARPMGSDVFSPTMTNWGGKKKSSKIAASQPGW